MQEGSMKKVLEIRLVSVKNVHQEVVEREKLGYVSIKFSIGQIVGMSSKKRVPQKNKNKKKKEVGKTNTNIVRSGSGSGSESIVKFNEDFLVEYESRGGDDVIYLQLMGSKTSLISFGAGESGEGEGEGEEDEREIGGTMVKNFEQRLIQSIPITFMDVTLGTKGNKKKNAVKMNENVFVTFVLTGVNFGMLPPSSFSKLRKNTEEKSRKEVKIEFGKFIYFVVTMLEKFEKKEEKDRGKVIKGLNYEEFLVAGERIFERDLSKLSGEIEIYNKILSKCGIKIKVLKNFEKNKTSLMKKINASVLIKLLGNLKKNDRMSSFYKNLKDEMLGQLNYPGHSMDFIKRMRVKKKKYGITMRTAISHKRQPSHTMNSNEVKKVSRKKKKNVSQLLGKGQKRKRDRYANTSTQSVIVDRKKIDRQLLQERVMSAKDDSSKHRSSLDSKISDYFYSGFDEKDRVELDEVNLSNFFREESDENGKKNFMRNLFDCFEGSKKNLVDQDDLNFFSGLFNIKFKELKLKYLLFYENNVIVFKGVCTSSMFKLPKRVCIKFFKIPGVVACDKKRFKTLLKSIAVLLKPTKYPNIVENGKGSKILENDSSLLCPYLLKYFGLVLKRGHIGIVSEDAGFGTLRDFVAKNRDNENYGLTEKLKLLYQISIGVKNLHFRRLLHKNLCSSNVLVDKNLNIKLVDFAIHDAISTHIFGIDVSNIADNNQKRQLYWEREGENIKYHSPELLKDPVGGYSTKSDCYAFAILSFEILRSSFETHFGKVTKDMRRKRKRRTFKKVRDSVQYAKEQDVVDIVVNRSQNSGELLKTRMLQNNDLRPDLSLIEGAHWWTEDLLSRCWKQEEDFRLEFKDICMIFEDKLLISEDRMSLLPSIVCIDNLSIYHRKMFLKNAGVSLGGIGMNNIELLKREEEKLMLSKPKRLFVKEKHDDDDDAVEFELKKFAIGEIEKSVRMTKKWKGWKIQSIFLRKVANNPIFNKRKSKKKVRSSFFRLEVDEDVRLVKQNSMIIVVFQKRYTQEKRKSSEPVFLYMKEFEKKDRKVTLRASKSIPQQEFLVTDLSFHGLTTLIYERKICDGKKIQKLYFVNSRNNKVVQELKQGKAGKKDFLSLSDGSMVFFELETESRENDVGGSYNVLKSKFEKYVKEQEEKLAAFEKEKVAEIEDLKKLHSDEIDLYKGEISSMETEMDQMVRKYEGQIVDYQMEAKKWKEISSKILGVIESKD